MSTSTNGYEKKNQGQGYHSNIINDGGTNVDYLVDLRSDTVTKPSKEMREKIANAIVGDDIMKEDPTVNELENRFAQKLGKEAAIFITCGSMGNLISVLIHCNNRGAEAIVGDCSHQFLYEQGSMAQFGGVQVNTIPNEPDGTYSITKVIKSIRPNDIHFTKTSLICVENTHNMCGGRVVPLKWLDEISQVGRDYGIPMHMDGARLFNASVASGVPVDRIVRDFDSVTVCLSKGLGAPIGSVLAGSQSFITQARRMRKALGGAMRQVGIIAAAGLYCLDHMIDRLAIDHEHTILIANAIHSLKNPLVSIDLDMVETNILLLNINGMIADDICVRLNTITNDEKEFLGNSIQILSSPKSSTQIRLVLHCDITKEMALKAANKICYVIKELSTSHN